MALMKSPVTKRSIVFDGHRTSVSLEDAFWSDLKKIANAQEMTVSELVAMIDDSREGNLSSAIRTFVLEYIRLVQGGPTPLVRHFNFDAIRRGADDDPGSNGTHSPTSYLAIF